MIFMKRIFFLPILLFVPTLVLAEKAQPSPRPDADVLMKCVYVPLADEKSSSLPTQPVGFKFSLERGNNNEVSVDIYSLSEEKYLIRQIGHAEMVNSLQAVTSVSTAAEILDGLELAEDSPFDFFFTLDSQSSGTVQVMTTFTGQTYSLMKITCRRAPPAGPSDVPTQTGAQAVPAQE